MFCLGGVGSHLVDHVCWERDKVGHVWYPRKALRMGFPNIGYRHSKSYKIKNKRKIWAIFP